MGSASQPVGIWESMRRYPAHWMSGALVVWLTGAGMWNAEQAITYVIANSQFRIQTGLVHDFSALGLLVTSVLLPFGLLMVLWGWLMDRFSSRRCTLIAVPISAVGLAVIATSRSVPLLFLGLIILGCGASVYFPVAFVVARRWIPRSERSLFFVMIFTFMSLGGLVFQTIGAALISRVGWTAAFWLYVAVLAGVEALYLWVYHDAPDAHPRIRPEEVEFLRRDEAEWVARQSETGLLLRHSVSSTLGDPRYWFAFLALIANTAGTFGYFAWAPSYFVHVRHFDLVSAAFLIMLVGLVGSIVIHPIGGWFQDRTGMRGLTAIASAALLVAIYATGVSVASALASVVLLNLVGTFTGFFGSAAQAVTTSISDPKIVGVTTGIQNTLAQTLASFTPVVMGMAIAAAGGSYIGGFYVLMAVAVIGAIGGAGLSVYEIRARRLLRPPAAVPEG